MTLPTPNQNYATANGTSFTSPFLTAFRTRAPTSNDINYPVQQRWVNTVSEIEYILSGFTSFGAQLQATWLELGSSFSGVTTLTGNSGGAIAPVAGNINVVGDGSTISIAGAGNTLTASLSGEVTNLYNTDAGTATPSGNAITIAGGTGINTSGSGSTVTINLTTPVTVAHGGTGKTSQTAYSLVCGGTTNTGAFQAVGPSSSTNAILMPTGASSLPAFTTTGTPYVSGISFNAGTNTLSSYTNGTWTPALSIGGSAAGITYSAQTGGYVQIGNVVFITIQLVLTSAGSNTGAVLITNLPFTSAGTGIVPKMLWSQWLGMTVSAGNLIGMQVESTSTQGTMYIFGANGGGGAVLQQGVNVTLTNGSNIAIEGFYFI